MANAMDDARHEADTYGRMGDYQIFCVWVGD